MDAIEKAIYRTASTQAGGVKGLATRLGLQPGTFSNKCNPAMEGHVLNVRELVAMIEQTGDKSVLQEIARRFDCVCVPIKPYEGVSDMDLLDAWSDWDIERAETIREIRAALDQGQVTPEQLDRIEREMFEDFEKELGLLARLSGLLVSANNAD